MNKATLVFLSFNLDYKSNKTFIIFFVRNHHISLETNKNYIY